MIFTNKHVITAMIVTPILAVIAWFGVDYMASDRAEPPQTGQSYELVGKSNCRWESGECDLKNGNFEINLKPVFLADKSMEIRLKSNFPLEGAKLAMITGAEDDSAPSPMHTEDFSHTRWYLRLEKPIAENSRIRLAIKQNGTLYYADTATTFFVSKQPLDR